MKLWTIPIGLRPEIYNHSQLQKMENFTATGEENTRLDMGGEMDVANRFNRIVIYTATGVKPLARVYESRR